MKKQETNQENQNQIPTNNNLNNQTNSAVRRLLASSALSSAIISWIATAQGLHIYVFNYYWQAAIISAAIQGTLFAFSIKAIPLMKKLRIRGKFVMAILWICILMSSSIFSYVYISKNVYSDKLLQKDSNRIMLTQYLELYSLLDDIIEENKKELRSEMEEYIVLLVDDDGMIEISKEDKDDLKRIKDNIEGYVQGNVIVFLDNIQLGSYSENDIQTLNDMLDDEQQDNNTQIENIQQQVDRKKEQVLAINERLKTFRSTESEEYMNLTEELSELNVQIEKLQQNLDDLNNRTRNLNECKNKIKYIEGGLERKLYNETLELRRYLNEDKLNTNGLIEVAERIYNDLFTYNISSNDPRLLEYNNFKNNATQYALLVEKKEIISNDREKLYTIISENESIDEEDDDEKENERIDSSWEKASSNIQNVLKDIPQTYFENYFNKSKSEDQEKYSKNEIIELITNMDRLYLSDLNDFERAWTLLWSDIHIYKTLLWFSVIFAFGIDLFSFGTGVLLYFMDNEQEMDSNRKRVNLRKLRSNITEKNSHKNNTNTK